MLVSHSGPTCNIKLTICLFGRILGYPLFIHTPIAHEVCELHIYPFTYQFLLCSGYPRALDASSDSYPMKSGIVARAEQCFALLPVNVCSSSSLLQSSHFHHMCPFSLSKDTWDMSPLTTDIQSRIEDELVFMYILIDCHLRSQPVPVFLPCSGQKVYCVVVTLDGRSIRCLALQTVEGEVESPPIPTIRESFGKHGIIVSESFQTKQAVA